MSQNPTQKVESDSSIGCILGEEGDGAAELECLVTILDDDHCGVFAFEHEDFTVSENCGEAKIKVCRSSGKTQQSKTSSFYARYDDTLLLLFSIAYIMQNEVLKLL